MGPGRCWKLQDVGGQGGGGVRSPPMDSLSSWPALALLHDFTTMWVSEMAPE